MASPQLENGHTRIANEVFDSLMRCDLTGCEFSLIYLVIRKTWGWHKKDSEISIDEFCRLTKRPRTTVTDSLHHLRQINMLRCEPGGGRGKPSKWGFNKDWQTWHISIRSTGQNNKLSEIKYPNARTVYDRRTGQFIDQIRTVSPCNLFETIEHEPPKESIKERKKENIGDTSVSPNPRTDEAYEIFRAEFEEHRHVPYQQNKADFVRLASLRKALGCNGKGTPPAWVQAIHNYFESPQGKYSLSDLCSRFDVFHNGSLDRFGKPANGNTTALREMTREELILEKNQQTFREVMGDEAK